MVKEPNEGKAPGQFGNQGQVIPSAAAPKEDKEERLQRTKDHAPSDQGSAMGAKRANAQGREDLPEGLAPGGPKATKVQQRDPETPRTSHSEPTNKDARSKG